MNTTRGQPTRAVYGLSVLLLKLLREEQPLGLCFALDRPEPTFRHRLNAAYKATRAPTPHDLSAEWPLLERLIEASGVPAFGVAGFEADDVLATLANRLREAEIASLIASGDRDVLQAASGGCSVLFVGRRGQPSLRFDEAAVVRRFGVQPRELSSYLALVGDVSDNVGGVPGIGPRTARQLLERYGSVAELLRALEALEPRRLRDKLEAHKTELHENAELMRLRTDVPLPDAPLFASIEPGGWLKLRALFEELEFKSLLPRLEALSRAG